MLQKVSCIADFSGPNYAFKDYLNYQKSNSKPKQPVPNFKTVLASAIKAVK